MRLILPLVLLVFVVWGCDPVTIDSPDTSSSGSSTSSGMGGNGSSSGSGGTAPGTLECTDDTDCVLVNSCCSCAGVPANGPFPDCPAVECFAPVCDANGIFDTKAICRAGRCVVDADCNHNHALCDSLPPTCPPGQTAHLAGGCWGGCIAVTECGEVGECTQCPQGTACVENTSFMIERHCVTMPTACNGQVNCACMGDITCIQPFGLCVDTSEPVLMCECPTC